MRKNLIILNSREHKKKQTNRFLTVLFIGLIVSGGLYFLLHQRDVKISGMKFYYYDYQKNELVPVQKNFNATGSQEKAVKLVIESLSIPPEKSELISLIPAYSKIKSVQLQNELCDIVFESSILSEQVNTVSKEAAAVYSIVNTLTELPNIQKVKISIDGKKDPFFKRYITITDPLVRLIGPLPKGLNTLLYFYHEELDSFIGEYREIPATEDQNQLAFNIVNQLLLGSSHPKATSYFPGGTKLNNVTINNSIAAVDFSKEIRRFSLGAEEELILVNCLVLSLTELDSVSRVDFLVEGKEAYTLAGHVKTNQPISRWFGLKDPQDIVLYFVTKLESTTFFLAQIQHQDKKVSPNEILQLLLKGPTAEGRENGILTDIPSPTKLNGLIPRENNELIVDIGLEINKYSSAQQEASSLKQIFLTLSENTNFNKVMFYFNGKNMESLPFGTDTSQFFSK